MDIHWLALLKVALVSLAFGAGIVTVFSVGLLGLARAEGAADDGSPTMGRVLAGTCFAVCAATVLFGLWLLVPQFH